MPSGSNKPAGLLSKELTFDRRQEQPVEDIVDDDPTILMDDVPEPAPPPKRTPPPRVPAPRPSAPEGVPPWARDSGGGARSHAVLAHVPDAEETPTTDDPAPPLSARSPKPVPVTSGMNEVHARPAALWRRTLAWLIDSTAVLTVVAVYLALATLVTGRRPTAGGATGIDAWVARLHAIEPLLLPGVVLALVIALAYSVAFTILWDGRTPGRRVLGIQLVDRTGLAPTPSRACIRAALSALSAAAFLGGYWVALFDRRGQTLHDKLTATFVVSHT